MGIDIKDRKANSTVSSKLAVPQDLNEKGRQEVIARLNPLVADAFALYIKCKNFHWHMSGSHFRDYHLLFDEQADQIFAMIDVLAERVRKLGGLTIRSIGHIDRLKRVADNDESLLEPNQMLHQLLEDNRAFIIHLREAHQACDDIQDSATASFLEVFIDETERRVWFLFETLA